MTSPISLRGHLTPVASRRGVLPSQAEAGLTSDNLHLSEPSNSASYRAIDCTNYDDAVRDYVQASIAPATLRAYRADIEHFRTWGGTIPATDVQVAAYLAAHAGTLAVATLTRRLASISQAHAIANVPSPTGSALVRATMRGIRRTVSAVSAPPFSWRPEGRPWRSSGGSFCV